jgi:hypothetical protein
VNQNSVAQLETLALIEEYKSLRSEIKQRVTNQLTVAGGNLVLVAASIQYLLPHFGITISVLVAPVLFAAVSWLYFEQDVFIIHAASYLHQSLRPAIIARVNSGQPGLQHDVKQIMAWESFRRESLFGGTFDRAFLWFMTVFRVLATAGPGIAILLGIVLIWLEPRKYLSAAGRYNHDPIIDGILFGLDSFIQLVLVYLAISIRSLYGTISVVQP